MEKIALDQIKTAEVRGALAAFMDAGLLKMAASQEEFDGLVEKVAGKLGDSYDLQKVAAVTDEVMAEVPAEQEKTASMDKEAAEKQVTACKAAMGDLLLMKTAGKIDNDTFVKEIGALMKVAGSIWDNARSLHAAKQSQYDELFGNPTMRQKIVDALYEKRNAAKNAVADAVSYAKGKAAQGADAMKSGLSSAVKSVKAHPRISGGLGAAAGLAGLGVLGKTLYDRYAV